MFLYARKIAAFGQREVQPQEFLHGPLRSALFAYIGTLTFILVYMA